jgi:hypothetical protein
LISFPVAPIHPFDSAQLCLCGLVLSPTQYARTQTSCMTYGHIHGSFCLLPDERWQLPRTTVPWFRNNIQNVAMDMIAAGPCRML